MQNNIKVSVCVVTYNQEDLIAQCLESLVTQETNFEYEIIVSDDCSTDNTPKVIKEFEKKYPDIIKPILHKKNLGAGKNFLFVHQQAQGEYIAHMDGDDYALPGKLQAQADFLDATPDCNIVWHRVKVLHPLTNKLSNDLIEYGKLPKKGFLQGDVLQLISIGTNSSKMYRAYNISMTFPDFEIVDYFMNVEEVSNKKAYYVDDKFYGVYRAGIGVSSTGNITRVILCKSFLYFAHKYPHLEDRVNAAALLYFLVDLKNGRPTAKDFFKVFIQTFHIKSFYNIYKYWEIIKMLRLPSS